MAGEVAGFGFLNAETIRPKGHSPMEPMHNEFEWSGVKFARRRPPLRLARFMVPPIVLLLAVGAMTDAIMLALDGVVVVLVVWFGLAMWGRRRVR